MRPASPLPPAGPTNGPARPGPRSQEETILPQLVSVWRERPTAQQLGRDILSGVLVGVVALPLAIAFAIASGVRPEQGLATAIVAGFLISALGGSRVQIGGPTGAFVVLVAGVVQKFGVEGLAVATVMAGVLLVVMGFARLGTVIQFVPYPVTVGFTSGIAVIIATTQVPDLLGLSIEHVPADFLGKVRCVAGHLAEVQPASLALGVLTVLVAVFGPKLTRRVPASLIAIVLTTAIVHLAHLPVATIADRFGAVPSSLPRPSLPSFDLAMLRELSPSALAIAALAAIESLLSAVVADGMLGTRHRPNTELVAQGVANLVSPLFGGIPATGAIARTATNVKNGGRTPVAGMVHALTLLLVLLLLGHWASLVPMATLAGILLVVAYHMSEWRVFVRLFDTPRSDVLVLLCTFSLTVLVDLVVAIEVGVVLAAFLFMRRMALLAGVRSVRESGPGDDSDAELLREELPEGVEVYEVQGALFFGAARKFETAILQVERTPAFLVLRLRQVPAVDATGLRALEDVIGRAAKGGTHTLLCEVHASVETALRRSGVLDRLGPGSLQPDLRAALAEIRSREVAAS